MLQIHSFEFLKDNLAYPEGAHWARLQNGFAFVEWEGDRVWMTVDGEAQVLFELGSGEGPSGLCQDMTGNFWLCLYSAGKLVWYDPQGMEMAAYNTCAGQRFKGPNDLVMDVRGGIYFTDSGDFEHDWQSGDPAGALYYRSVDGELACVDSGLCYPNGVALSPGGGTLYLAEHRQNRILAYDVAEAGKLSNQRVFYELDVDCLLPEEEAFSLGPDGMCVDSQGNLWVAHYGGGKLVVLSPDGKLNSMFYLPNGRKPTNVALSPDNHWVYITEVEYGRVIKIGIGE
ncbi:MAG: SMP-30/gluconolactonase/LRE family protein [Anaerolineales bacterium]|nr:SMP-30/gluconolactonase/LRE family protein [Anaerolineales bacterium]